jgi:hypothetical protein
MALLDVRIYRGANTDLDHYLVIAILRMPVTNAKKAKGKHHEKCDISKLRVPQTFHLEVTECLCHIPYSHEGTVNEEWEEVEKSNSSRHR